MTAPSEDAVGVARLRVESYRNPIAFSDDEFAEYLDAYAAAVESRVRAECAAERLADSVKRVGAGQLPERIADFGRATP